MAANTSRYTSQEESKLPAPEGHLMKSDRRFYLPPDFNVERLLDDIFPERKLARVRAAESQTFVGEFSDAVCPDCLGYIRRDGACDCPAVPRVVA